MPLYHYAAYTQTGDTETGSVEAQSSSEALGILAARGLVPFETKEAKRSHSASNLPLKKKINLEDISLLSRELATLLEVQIPLDDALSLLANQMPNARSKRLVDAILTAVMGGSSLSSALADQGPRIPPIMTSLVRAGEARGALGPTLSELARLLEGRAEVKARIRSALVYPLALAVVAVGTLIVILTFLFPSLLEMFEESRVEPPVILALSRDVSAFFEQHWKVILPSIAIALAGAIIAAPRSAMRAAFMGLSDQLPVIGALRKRLAIAAFSRTLGTLLRNDVQVVEALSITAEVVTGTRLADQLREAMSSLQRGTRLSVALAASDALPQPASRLIAIGEEANRVDSMLLHLADMYEREATRSLERVMTLISPLVTVLIGILVGGIVLSVMQAVLSINNLALN